MDGLQKMLVRVMKMIDEPPHPIHLPVLRYWKRGWAEVEGKLSELDRAQIQDLLLIDQASALTTVFLPTSHTTHNCSTCASCTIKNYY